MIPSEPHNLDEFRRQFGAESFWCGTEIGGCGQQLSTKRYETKVCHFSHYPDHSGARAACDRSAGGEDSADHLFIKRHVTAWLRQRGHVPRVELRRTTEGVATTVDFQLPATAQHLRFVLRSDTYRTWRRAADSLAAKQGHIEWLFGEDDVITRDTMARRGYALRLRCETAVSADGLADRRVLIGTEAQGFPVEWVGLEQCRLDRTGLITPALDRMRAEGKVRHGNTGNDPLPVALTVVTAGMVFATDLGGCRDDEASTAAPAAFHAHGRRLVPGFLKLPGSRILRTYLSLPEEAPPPTEEHVYRPAGTVQLLITEYGAGQPAAWCVRADGLTSISALEAERAGLWRPEVAVGVPLDAPRAPAAPSVERVVPARSAEALRVREVLQQTARAGTTITWQELGRRARLPLVQLSDAKRRALLVEADRPDSEDAAPLCILVVDSAGGALPYLQTALRQLNLDVPTSPAAFTTWCERTRARAYRDHRARSAQLSERRPGNAEVGSAAANLAALRVLLGRARTRLPQAEGADRKKLAHLVDRAEAHAAGYARARTTAGTLSQWSGTFRLLHKDLSQALRRLDALPRRATARPVGAPAVVADSKKAANRKSDEVPAAPPRPPAAAKPSPASVPAVDEALRDFEWLTAEIRVALAEDDLAAVETARRMAGPLYAQGLAPADRERFTPFMREVKRWCHDRDPSKKDPNLRRIRRLLATWSRKDTDAARLASALREIDDLTTRSELDLPPREADTVARMRARLRKLRPATPTSVPGASAPTAPRETPTQSSATRRPAPRGDGRLPANRIDSCAGQVRTILEEAARSETLLSWGQIRARAGGRLPHLHPDDQGEILVAVDWRTPADEPLLSCLVAGADRSHHWLYRHVRHSLGRERIPEAELPAHWPVEVLRLRQIWRHRR